MLEGYKEAFLIDKKINEKIKQHTINIENHIEWLRFARTIKTSCEIIEKEAEKFIKRNNYENAF